MRGPLEVGYVIVLFSVFSRGCLSNKGVGRYLLESTVALCGRYDYMFRMLLHVSALGFQCIFNDVQGFQSFFIRTK